jgi:putative membrane protein
MKRYGFLSIALVAAITMGCNANDSRDANANNPSGSAVGTAGATDRSVTGGDRDFVRDVSMANMAEIELGKLAAERGTNAEVKKFAQTMVDDHTKAGDQLMAIASQHSIQTATDLGDNHRDLREKLSNLKGAEFDREYIDAMVDEHEDVLDKLGSKVDQQSLEDYRTKLTDRAANEKVVAEVEATAITAEKSDNPVTQSINQWAATSYPVVHAHHETAKKLQESLKKRMTN